MCLYKADSANSGNSTPYDEECSEEHIMMCALGGGMVGS